MEQKITVLQGKTFHVELQSMWGSTPYGWCLQSLPEGILLIGVENVPTGTIAPVLQRFYFGAVSEASDVRLEFVLVSTLQLEDVKDSYTAVVSVIPSDSEQFVSYSENTIYGYTGGVPDPGVKYGYPCAASAQTNIPYGLYDPCDPTVKYGYPCASSAQATVPYGVFNACDPTVKYGYPCASSAQAIVPYGAFNSCGPAMDYGYPIVAYGVPYPGLKYGYPCC